MVFSSSSSSAGILSHTGAEKRVNLSLLLYVTLSSLKRQHTCTHIHRKWLHVETGEGTDVTYRIFHADKPFWSTAKHHSPGKSSKTGFPVEALLQTGSPVVFPHRTVGCTEKGRGQTLQGCMLISGCGPIIHMIMIAAWERRSPWHRGLEEPRQAKPGVLSRGSTLYQEQAPLILEYQCPAGFPSNLISGEPQLISNR